jgi:hypothetical protein
MFRPNCRATLRLIFEQVECIIDNVSIYEISLLQELRKIIVVCFIET